MPARRRRSTTGSRSTTTTTRRTSPKRTKKPAPEVPTAGPGERVWVLAVPFRAAAPGAQWHAGLQAHVWVGRELPPELAPYDPPPYTFERFLEDELNEKPRPLPMARRMTPRDQQCDGADVVAAHAAAGGRVFLLGDDPGVGKTGTAILAVKAIAEQRDVRTVLVVADRPAAITIPHWTRSIAGFGDGGLRWCVTTWDRLAKVSKLRFDVVVADEAHMVRHTTTQRWKHWKAVSGAGRVKDAPYVLAATATPAHTPLELPYLAPEFAARHAEPPQGVGRPAQEARRRTGSTWNVAATAGSGPRTPPSGAPTCAAAGLARRRRTAGDAAPAGALGPGLGDRHPRGAHPRRAGCLRVGVVGVPRRDAAGPAGAAEREGPRRAACGSGRRPG